MSAKFYIFILFLGLYWFFCLYIGFKSQKKIVAPVDFFIFGRQLPSWSFFCILTGTIFSGWIFYLQPGLIFMNGFPYALTSLCVIAIPLIGICFSKKQWMLSKRFGFVTPSEMIATYFKSDILRCLIVFIGLGFAIPFIAMQLSFGGLLLNILSDDIIGRNSAAILIGSIIVVYVSTGGIRSMIYIDSLQFLLVIFGVIFVGFLAYDLVGGWDLLNESLSRIANLKEKFFNLKQNYGAYLSVPSTIEKVELLNQKLSYNGIWTASMILTFVFALSGMQISPSVSMLIFASKGISNIGTQQIWFSSFLIGFLLIFFTTAIGAGSVMLGGNNIINESGNNISNILPADLYPNFFDSLVPHLINLVGEYSIIFFGLLALCAIAATQSIGSLYLTSSAMVSRDIIKRFFVKNLNNKEQIFTSRIVLMLVFIVSLILSIISEGNVLELGSFALSMACQMFVPLLAICYFRWFTRQGVAFGLAVGVITVIFTESIGQNILSDSVFWSKWPLTIHSAFWGVFFNLISASIISFITQETKETNHKQKFHDFIDEHRNYSLTRRSLKPSAWIMSVAWLYFAIGPGLMLGNELFGKPINVESWSFGMPSIWVWQLIFWLLGILLVWFLATKMEMSSPTEKNIIPQTEDIGSSYRG